MENKKKRSTLVLRALIFGAALAVFLYSGWQLLTMYRAYRKADQEYAGLEAEFTAPRQPAEEKAEQAGTPASGGAASGGTSQETVPETEAAYPLVPPIEVDWDALRAANSEVVGWIFVDALEKVSYPVCRGDDNDYYLHHTFRREEVFAGAIFMDCRNSADFSDPNTVIYGHNMKNGSMFGTLKKLRDSDLLNGSPHVWILTPDGDACYEIFSVFTTPADGEVYDLYPENGEEFLAWEERMKARSAVDRDTALRADDRTVVLSTCTGNDETRWVVLAKRIFPEEQP